jgi:hypothetical protein
MMGLRVSIGAELKGFCHDLVLVELGFEGENMEFEFAKVRLLFPVFELFFNVQLCLVDSRHKRTIKAGGG